MKKFKIIKDYYIEDENIFNKEIFSFKSGITVLVGCNGYGKTTLLNILEEKLEKNKIKYMKYNDLEDGRYYSKDIALYNHDYKLLSKLVTSSEGENIYTNIGIFVEKLGEFISNTDDDNIWILLDSIDSGLSIDNIIEIKEFFNYLINEEKDKNIYIVISSNVYEVAKDEQCFDVYNGKYLTFNNYEDYRNFILQSREIKGKRYNKTTD